MTSTLARLVTRRPLLTMLVWAVVVTAGFGLGVGVFDRLVTDVGTVPGSESARTAGLLAEVAPAPTRLTAVVTGTGPAVAGSATAAVAEVRTLPGVAEVSDPSPATSGEALLIQVTLAEPMTGGAAVAAADRLRQIDAPAVAVTGGPLTDDDFTNQAQRDLVQAELLSLPVVLVLLLVFFGGLLAAGLPVLIAGVAIGATFGILYAFSLASDVSVYAIQVTTMLAVALAVDYALLMVSRFKEERRTAPEVATAVARTVATAGRTVLFSGLVVAVALAGLVFFNDPFLRSMGLAGAAVVIVDMLAALTLLPALLVRFGHRIKPARAARPDGGRFARIARTVQRRPVLTLVATGGVMLVFAAPALGLTVSTGDPRLLPAATETRQVWDGLTDHFGGTQEAAGEPAGEPAGESAGEPAPEPAGPGLAGPPPVVVLAEAGVADPALAGWLARVADLPGVAGTDLRPAGDSQAVLVVRATDEPHAPVTNELVTAIRELPAPFEKAVTGDAAQLVDYQQMLGQRLPWAAGFVVLGTLLLLFAFTGSLILPVKAILTNLLSIAAALGIVVWVFQHGQLAGLVGAEGLGYVHLTVPVLVAAIAFGLSVDYEVFLLSRIRERWLAGAGPHQSVADGLQRTGGIVTAAALVIAVVFAGFIPGGFVPIKAVGLGLVLAIVLDATIVRMLLVPATMTLLGRRNWWLPGPLARLHARVAGSEPPPTAAPPAAAPSAAPVTGVGAVGSTAGTASPRR